MQRVDAIGDVQRRALLPLGQEVAHRAIHRPRQSHGDALHGDQRERSVDRAHRRRIAAQHAPARLVDVHVARRFRSGSSRSTTRLMVVSMPEIVEQNRPRMSQRSGRARRGDCGSTAL